MFSSHPLSMTSWAALLLTFLVLCSARSSSTASSHNNNHHLRHLAETTIGKDYYLWSSQEIRNKLLEWADLYPDFVRVTTSQQAFGLPTAGGDDDCPFDDGVGCLNYILTIQDYTVHPEESASSTALPEVLWSGCVHGNERVGPTAVMEAASLLLEAASCEAKPNKSIKQHVGHAIHDGPTWISELETAKKCRTDLESRGIDTRHRQWLARLVATRRIVIVPTANALGYYRNKREEEHVDPNRDFPFDVKDPTKCMQTIAGRTLNEVFRQHMIQLSLTFHGGMEVVAYEWGAPTYLGSYSPDDRAQNEIASSYSRYGGGWTQSPMYKFGTMNDLVYYVEGGMEDWAYAASWDPDRVIECRATQYGGYPAEKTRYNNSTLRVFNMLVETSDTKEPKTHLGSSGQVLMTDPANNGHVSRNIRLALLAADLVEPYVSITSVNDLALSDDIIPLAQRVDPTACQRTKGVMIPQNANSITVEWTVGGAITVDETSLIYGRWSDLQDEAVSCMAQPNADKLSNLIVATDQTAKNGTGFFSHDGPYPPPSKQTSSGQEILGPIFRATLDVSKYRPHDEIVVLARARVDQSWREQPDTIKPKLPPQSHVVNARTNPEWHHESEGKVIQGRLDWYSTIPLTIVIGDYTDSVGKQAGRQVGTIELSNRFGQTTGETKGGISPSRARDGRDLSWKHLLGLFFVLACGGAACAVCVHYKQQATHQRIVNELMEEQEEAFGGPKPYTDDYEDDDDEDEVDWEEEENGIQDNGHDEGGLELRQYTIT